ncbi:MAG: ABC transporter ATP-binding protein, partial [Vicinamibacterales bacterium]|nr:ABC transporter ATP-binding protein [Vicinamibacterales bacterium]
MERLGVDLPGYGGIRPVEDVSFTVRRGETLALVGESGCGKSLTALALLGIAPAGGRLRGRVHFDGRDLLSLPPAELRAVRGAGIGFVFQEPMAALNPVHTIGEHIVETLEVHGIAAGRAARARAVEVLGEVALPDPRARVDDYPHQLSGGMRQRAMLAIALACRPALLVADEPTTALDATTQVQVLELLGQLRDRFELAVLLVSHDLALVSHTATRVAVMYAGRIVEQAPVAAVFASPAHPYTQGLLSSIP